MSERININPKEMCILTYNHDRKTWDEKTEKINALYEAFIHGTFTGYNVYFKGGQKKYFYPKQNIKILNFQETVPLEDVEVIADGSAVDAVKVEKFSDGFYRVHSGLKNFLTDKIRFESNRYRKTYKYFSDLAEKGLKISEDDTPLYYLSKNFTRSAINPDSCLIDYLKGRFRKNNKHEQIILPFSFNQSQKTAIKNALNNNISVIEGPPGTGKTQTILNLIVNVVANGYTCAVVSNNNTAIENVYDKLTEEEFSFFIASLGNRERVDSFFSGDNAGDLTDFLKKDFSPVTDEIRCRIDKLAPVLDDVFKAENELAKKMTEKIEMEKELEHITAITDDVYQISQNHKSYDYLKLKIRLESGKPMNIFNRIWNNFRFKTIIEKDDNSLLLDAVERLFYVSKIRENDDLISNDEKFLGENNRTEIKKEFQDLSRRIFNEVLYQRYNKKEFPPFTVKNYKADFNDFLERYPVLISTTHSLSGNVGNNVTLDYLIIDEASQGDLLSSLLAINCAKNLIVVGDSKQLQQIEDESLIPYSRELSQKYGIDSGYRYDTNSIIKSVKTAVKDVPTTLLKEHYRCAPDIISFCNKMFYNNELVVMTENRGTHLNVVKTVPGNHARRNPKGSGQYNEREIDEIAVLLNDTPSSEIGVITPFRHQADLIRDRFSKTHIKADTVHKYQGQQQNEVILSFVVNSLDKTDVTAENRLYDFITNKELLNVAISRGINKVTIIVSDKVYHSSNNVIKDLIDYIEYLYGNSITRESTITSIFDKLYVENRNALIELFQKKSQKYYTELLMDRLVSDLIKFSPVISYTMHARVGRILTDFSGFNENETRYLKHPWTHVDFLFYNSISRKPLFALEVDGIKYHEQSIKQSGRDDIKDKAFLQCGIPLHRFKTNESGEEQRLKSILDQYAY